MENNDGSNRLPSIDNLTAILLQETMRQLNQINPVNEDIGTGGAVHQLSTRTDDLNRLLDTAYDVFRDYNNVMQNYNINIASILQYINNTQRIIGRSATERSNGNGSSRSNGNRPLRSNGNGPLRSNGNGPLRSNGNRPLRSNGNRPLRSNGNLSSRTNTINPTFSQNTIPSPVLNSSTGTNTLDQSLVFTYLFEPLLQEGEQNENQRPMTRDEISTTTRTFSYIRDSLPENNRSCPIGMDTFLPGDVLCEIRGCGHIFRRPPLMNWLHRSSQCPVCRYHIRTFTEPITDSSLNILPLSSNLPIQPSDNTIPQDNAQNQDADDISDVSDIEIDNEMD
jgi:hypothetical protein